MKDIIKEFNMIDLLGMMFPGSILVGLACIEFQIKEILEKAFGSDAVSGMLLAIILFGGYAAGMLLHEVADMAEKTLWGIPWFNPKWYWEKKTDSAQEEKKPDSNQPAGETTPAQPAQKNQDKPGQYGGRRGWQIFGAPITYIFVMAVLIAAPMFCPMFFSMFFPKCCIKPYVPYVAEIAIFMVSGIIVGCFCYKKHDASVSKKTEKKSKISLFDGFRTMARNMLVLSFVLGFFSALNGRSRVLHIMRQAKIVILINPLLLKITFFLVLLLFSIRYWHYSSLKERELHDSSKNDPSQESDADAKKQNKLSACQFIQVYVNRKK